MKTSHLLLACSSFSLLGVWNAHATIAVQSLWHLGEEGSLGANNRPIDSVDADGTFNNFGGGSTGTVGTGTVEAPGSTAYLFLPGTSDGYYSSPVQAIPAENFGVEVWVRVAAADITQGNKIILTLGSEGGAYAISINDGGRTGWNASLRGASYVGNAVPVVADKWTHLALVRNNGVNEFYVDGNLAGTSTGATTNGGGVHLGIRPGGGGNFKGDLDELRIFNFNEGEFSVGDLQLPIPTRFVNVGAAYSFPVANLATAETSAFRLGGEANDRAAVTAVDGLNVVGDSGTKHVINVVREGVISTGTYPLIDYSGVIGGLGFAGLELGSLGRLQGSLVNNTVDSVVELLITGSVAGDVLWTAADGDLWNVESDVNWKFTDPDGPTTFFAGDAVRFDDTALTGAVTLAGTITPSSISINNSALPYRFSGTGISGSARLDKSGAGTLVLANPNTYTGRTTINEGTIQIGDGGANGAIGTGAITNLGSLVINRTGDLTIGGAIEGSGSINKQGSNTLTLAGSNTFTGPLTFTGIIKSGNTSALGSTSDATTVVSGATLDINGIGFGAEQIILNGSGVSGQGALVNTGAADQSGNAASNVTLASDASIGGTSRWDMRSGTFVLGGAFKLAKVGTNEIHLVSRTVSVKDIEVNSGVLIAEYGATVDDANPGSITLNSGGSFGVADYGAPVTISKPIVINGGVLMTASTTAFGNSTIAAGVTLATAASEISASSGAIFTLGGTVSGSGGLSKTGAGTVVLGSTSSYSGGTSVTNGILSLSQPTLSDASNVTIAGGVLNLNYDGSDTVATLVLGDVPQLPNTSYGATGSGATVIDDVHFSGTGRLFVAGPPANAYADWEILHGIQGAGAAADSDDDGIQNGIEFVIGGDPNGPDSSDKLPVTTLDADYVTFVYRRTAESNQDHPPFAEYSFTLAGWTTAVNGEPEVTPVLISTTPATEFTGDVVTVKVPRALAADGKIFVRLKVSYP